MSFKMKCPNCGNERALYESFGIRQCWECHKKTKSKKMNIEHTKDRLKPSIGKIIKEILDLCQFR